MDDEGWVEVSSERWTIDRSQKNEREPPDQIMVCFDRRAPTHLEPPSPCAPVPVANLRHSASLSRRLLLALYRGATAHRSTRQCLHRSNRCLADTIGAYGSCTTLRHDPVHRHVADSAAAPRTPVPRTPAEMRPSRSRRLRKAQVHRWPSEGFSRRVLRGECTRNVWGESGRRRRDVRRGERVQNDRDPLLSGESDDRGPDGSLVKHGRSALFCSGEEQGIGAAATLIVIVSIQSAHFVASISPLSRFFGERRRTRVGVRALLRTTETWLSDDISSSVSDAGRLVKRDDARPPGRNGCPLYALG